MDVVGGGEDATAKEMCSAAAARLGDPAGALLARGADVTGAGGSHKLVDQNECVRGEVTLGEVGGGFLICGGDDELLKICRRSGEDGDAVGCPVWRYPCAA